MTDFLDTFIAMTGTFWLGGGLISAIASYDTQNRPGSFIIVMMLWPYLLFIAGDPYELRRWLRR